jgi:site-specific DNA recombinase
LKNQDLNILELHKLHILYVRVSTEEQAKKGYSLDTQIARCREKAIAEGADPEKILVIPDEGYSGEFMDRPGLNQLRELLYDKRVASVTVYDLDRLGRDASLLLAIGKEIDRAGAALQFVTYEYANTPEGKFFFTVRSGMAEYEKALIRERTIRGKRGKFEKGKLPNRPPYGYDFVAETKTWRVNDEEAEIVRYIFRSCVEGKGYRVITSDLNEQGKRNKQKKPFKDSHVWSILRSTTYVGMYTAFRERWKKVGHNEFEVSKTPESEWITIEVPAIITVDTMLQAEESRNKNKLVSKRNNKREYLLRGILKCGCCKGGMISRYAWKRQDRNHEYKYYYCHRQNAKLGCTAKMVPADEVDEKVWELFKEVAKGEKTIEELLSRQNITPVNHAAEIRWLEEQIEAIRKRRENIRATYNVGDLDDMEYQKDLKDTKKQLETCQQRLVQLTKSEQEYRRSIPAINPVELLNAQTIDEKQKLLNAWGIVVFAERVGDETIIGIGLEADMPKAERVTRRLTVVPT